MTSTLVRGSHLEDIAAILQVERSAWGNSAATESQLRSRITRFGQGNPVLEHEGQIVAYGSIIQLEQIPRGGFSWDEITRNGTNESHREQGTYLYGVSASAIKGKVPNALEHLVSYVVSYGQKKGCRSLSLGSRIPGFRKWTKQETGDLKSLARRYSEATGSGGKVLDPELRLYASNGFTIGRVLPNYYPCEDSLDFGVLVTLELD